MKLFLLTLTVTLAMGATLNVGPGEQYKTINELPKLLQAGDIIEIQPGTYKDVKAWPIAGAADNPVIVRCVGPAHCIFDAGDTNLQFTPRAIFEVADGAYSFLGPFSFRNAHNGGLSAAAIRIVKGTLEVDGQRGMKFRNCDNGIKSSVTMETAIIRNVDIQWCGRGSAAGHSIYIEGKKLTVEDSYFERTIGGIHFKTRARDVTLRRSQLLDSTDGEIQLANGPNTIAPGADALIEDNVIRTLAKGRVNCCRVNAFGHEGTAGTDRNGILRYYRNKVIMNAPNQILFSLDSVNAGLDARDNDFQGSANLIRQRYGTSGPITGTNNRVSPTVLPAPPPPPPNPWAIFDVLPALFVPPAAAASVDTIPPSQVTGLVGTQTPTGIILSWQPSTDAGGIARYEIVTSYGPFSYGENETSFYHVGDTVAGRTYTYQVIAVDRSENRATISAPFSYIRQ